MRSLTSSVGTCEAARVIRCPIADLHSLPHTFSFILPHRKGFGIILARCRSGWHISSATHSVYSCAHQDARAIVDIHSDIIRLARGPIRYWWRSQKVGEDTTKTRYFSLSVGNIDHLLCLRKLEHPCESRLRHQYPIRE